MAINELEKFLRLDYEKWKDNEYLHEMVNGQYVGITFGEFIEKVNYLAACLINRGYKDKHIGIYSPNSLAWMISDVAIMNYVGLRAGVCPRFFRRLRTLRGGRVRDRRRSLHRAW